MTDSTLRRTNYPLILSQVTLEEREADFNPEFVRRMASRIVWDVLAKSAREVSPGSRGAMIAFVDFS